MPRARSNSATPVEPHIWSSVLRGLQLPLEENNVDYLALLGECEIDAEILERIHGEIPFRNYLRFMETAAVRADDPLLGIRLARAAGPESLGALGFLFLSSRTVADALTDFCTYMNLLQDTTHVRVRREGDWASFSYQLYGIADIDCRQDVEFSLALTCRLIRMLGGPEVRLSAVSFRHSPSTAIADYERLLKVETRFNQESNSILMPFATTRLRGKLFDASLSGILKDFLNRELKRKDTIQSFSDQVKNVLLDAGVTPPLTAARTARYLGISRATLYRKLAAEGTTFGKVLNTVNFEIAKNYLSESSLSVTQIAHIVGFEESASFTRAFVRWSGGLTPSGFRRAGGSLAGIARRDV